jgi:hypothetical protein
MSTQRSAVASRTVAAALSVLLSACSAPAAPPPMGSLDAPPVDTERIRLADAEQWTHRRFVDADLDGDGSTERVIVAADVQIGARNTPLWEDGHRWAVIVEGGGARTLLYGAFVPNGDVETAVLSPDSTNHRNILVRERTPQQSRTFVVAYRRPGTVRTVSVAYDQVEQWVPSLTQ